MGLVMAAAASRIALAVLAMLALAACTPGSRFGQASPRLIGFNQPVPKGGGHYMIGQPYRIAGKTYVPRDEPNYSKVGVASWYGEDFHGRQTANGEIYDLDAVTAAHPTLPLPSYARVTNLENGRSITVRVNDRGPFVDDRIIDVSRTVAQKLDFADAGTAKVRVDYIGPAPLEAEDEKMLLASYREDGAAPVPFIGPRVQVAAAQPQPTAGTGDMPRSATVPAPQVRPSSALQDDPLAPLILRSGLSYAPAPARTPAQQAADELARPDLSALLAAAAARKANELGLSK